MEDRLVTLNRVREDRVYEWWSLDMDIEETCRNIRCNVPNNDAFIT